MKKTVNYSFFIVVIALLISSCNGTPKNENLLGKETHEVISEKKDECNDVHWSHHKGGDGPENWKNLCSGYSSCGGKIQSPINIDLNETIKSDNLCPFKVNYSSTKVDIINNGHTLQYKIFGNNTMLIDGKEYKLVQFHYHTESEHTINGKHFPIEVHFVHKYSDTDYAVVGIMYQEGEKNDLFTEYLSHFPLNEGEYVTDKMIELNKQLPSDLSYYHYKGSLTTPPCSEVVSWYVLKSHLEATKEQIEILSEMLYEHYRPVMPLNNRKVLSFEG